MSPRNDRRPRLKSLLPVVVVTLLLMAAGLASAQPPQPAENSQPYQSPLTALQHFVSKADGPRCPMVPTCSQYAAQAFREHNIFVGWMLTCDRLLRCGRDETRLAPIVRTADGPRAQDPLAANIFWWKKP